ncbi:hypothetical protein, partial [Paragemmobacter kunshanensis]|uniref:hypothetical protein n=1 Tax=Paragemmobacter kunshanensis TaxID=2583234 RepID=UPI0019CFA42E
LQHHVLYRKYNGQDSEISALLGKCGIEEHQSHTLARGTAHPTPSQISCLQVGHFSMEIPAQFRVEINTVRSSCAGR